MDSDEASQSDNNDADYDPNESFMDYGIEDQQAEAEFRATLRFVQVYMCIYTHMDSC